MKDLEKEERLLDLLSEQTLGNLAKEEERELEVLLELFPEYREDDSLELTAAMISLVGIDTRREEMPARLRSKIFADAQQFFTQAEDPTPVIPAAGSALSEVRANNVVDFPAKRFNWNWLGWAVAAAACLALVVNVWMTRNPEVNVAKIDVPPPVEAPKNNGQMMQEFMSSAPDMVKASWGDGNMPDVKGLKGEVVWSDSMQKGYMKFANLPANDGTKITYQLWIFDETQDPKTPIDGGVFNVNSNGEVIIPIDAKLKAKNPKMFAITMEKPGGVVMSDRGKIAGLAKV